MELFFHFLIGAYLWIGVVACGLSLIGQFIPVRPQPEVPQENYARLPWRTAPTGLTGLRVRAALVLQALSLLVLWPTAAVILISGRGDGAGRLPLFRSPTYSSLRFSTVLRQRDVGVINAIVSVGFAMLLWCAAEVVGPLEFVQTGCSRLLFALTCLFCSYAVGTTDLPSMLRRGRLNPYLAAATITLLEFAAIVVALVVSNAWPAGGSPGPATFVVEARRVLALGQLNAAVTSVHQASSSVLIAAAGLSFYTVVVKQVVQFRRLRRSAEDYAHIGQHHMFGGDVEQARALLEKMSPVDRNSSRVLGLRIRVLLADGAFDTALELTRALFTVNHDPSSVYFATSTREDLFWYMARSSIPFAHWRLFDVLRERGVSDGFLRSCVAFNLMYDGSAETHRHLVALQDDASCPITASYCTLLTAEASEVESAVARAIDTFASSVSSSLVTDSIVARLARIEVDVLPGAPLDEDDLVARSGEVVRVAAAEGVPVWVLWVVWQRLSYCMASIEAINERRDVVREIESQLAPILGRLSSAERGLYRASQRSAVKELRRWSRELP